MKQRNQLTGLRVFVCLFLTILLFIVHVYAQTGSPIFRHFTTEDGVPSSEVYFVLQDSKGFMWFATDHGVARFNGYEFRTFTTKDGLPDNTVFKLFEDDRKRIWMLTFSGKLYYFENNNIHPYRYNSLLNKSNENIIPMGVFVDQRDQVFVTFLGKSELKIDNMGTASLMFPDYTFTPQKYFIDEFGSGALLLSASFNFSDQKGHPVYVLHSHDSKTDTIFFPSVSTGKFCAIRLDSDKMIYALAKSLYEISGTSYKLLAELPFEVSFLMKDEHNNRVWAGTSNGVYCYDLRNFTSFTNHYLDKKNISGIIRDKEGGYWFTTLEDGIYYLPGEGIQCISLPEEHLQKPLCFATGKNGTAYAVYKGGALVELREGRVKLMYNPPKEKETLFMPNHLYADTVQDRIYFSQSLSGYYANGSFHSFNNIWQRGLQTNFLVRSDGTLACGGSSFVFRVVQDSLSIIKIAGLRINCLAETEDRRLLLGSNNGVLVYNEQTDQLSVFNKELNNTRVDDIKWLQHGLCFATKGRGVLILANGKISVIDESNGLCSDLVSKLFVTGNDAWCSTNMGISRIHFDDVSKPDYNVSTIHASDGLLSDEINDIIELNDTMYVATKSGISYFNKNTDFVNHTAPFVHLISLQINNRDTALEGRLELSHDQNNIRIGFIGISYRSKGKISYRYLLTNDNDTLSEFTSNRDVEFLSLVPGFYTFSISAMNNSGIGSQSASFSFYIRPAWWQTWWFRILMIVVAVAVVYLVYKNQVRKLHKKFTNERRQASLHLTALRAQMNPHFIFNIMNSIRHYMQNNDAASAEKYLTSFAKHMRNTLDNSETQEISLDEELKALKIYAELEMQGLKNGAEFIVKCDDEIDMNETMLPSLILQPFIENAIKHGVARLPGKGRIIIEIKKTADSILIVIEDNGLGRQGASQWNNLNTENHISHGTNITFERIAAYNKAYNRNIRVDLIDLKDENGKPAGTRVEIKI